jgi:hypothetical protein
MCFQRTYADIRNRGKISTGSVVAFERIPVTSIRSIADVGGFISNQVIRFKQSPCDIDGRGYKNFVHVVTVLRSNDHDEVMALEHTAGMKEYVPQRLSAMIEEYIARGGRVAWFPLKAHVQRRVDQAKVDKYVADHRTDRYNWTALPLPEMHYLPIKGRKRFQRQFCSEGIMSFWTNTGIELPYHRVWDGEFRDEPIKPWLYSPQEILGHSVIDRRRACEVIL